MVCAACCHITLVFAIIHLYDVFYFGTVSAHAFFRLLFNAALINEMEPSTIPVCPSLICLFNRGSTERTNSLIICVGYFCMYALFYVCV